MRTSSLPRLPRLPVFGLRAILGASMALAACGGATTPTDAAGGGGEGNAPPGSTAPGMTGPSPARPTNPAPIPPQPIGPYTGAVATTDVSILYPLPLAGEAGELVAPSETSNFGALLDQAAFVNANGNRNTIEHTDSTYPSGYANLRVVGIRLDPCAARPSPFRANGCTSEVRLVLQALQTQGASDEGPAGTYALDGGVHAAYDVPPDELVAMAKEILTLKKANGDLGLLELGPHPILVTQGIGGAFATGLRSILLYHVGQARLGRLTVFDHNMNPDEDGWTFHQADVGADGVLRRTNLPFFGFEELTVAGSPRHVPLTKSFADVMAMDPAPDDVEAILDRARPETAPQTGALGAAFQSALDVQNPDVHTSESTTCANCHLAEGAVNVGRELYGFTPIAPFTHPRSLARVDDRVNVVNLHAFGYLRRHVSVMQRTANESVVVATALEKVVGP